MANAATPPTCLTCMGNEKAVVDIAFSGITLDGPFFATASLDGKPMLRNGVTGDWIGTFQGSKAAVWSVDIDANAEIVATGAADYTAKLWDAMSGQSTHEFACKKIVKSVSLSRDTNLLATASTDGTVRVFDKRVGSESVSEHATQTVPSCVIFAENATSVLFGSDDATLSVWHPQHETVQTQSLSGPIKDLHRQPGKGLVITTTAAIHIHDEVKLNPLQDAFAIPDGIDAHSACVNPSSQYPSIVWGGSDNIVHTMCSKTGQETAAYRGHHGTIRCVRTSPDGELTATCAEDGTVRLWPTVPGKKYGLWTGLN
eukprot:m.95315 g.95315  ORF g.95315 m.95315 type:complete len:314 (-) comp13055_c0_seq3:2123-3064(-)